MIYAIRHERGERPSLLRADSLENAAAYWAWLVSGKQSNAQARRLTGFTTHRGIFRPIVVTNGYPLEAAPPFLVEETTITSDRKEASANG